MRRLVVPALLLWTALPAAADLPSFLTTADYSLYARVREEWISNSGQEDRNRLRYMIAGGAVLHPDSNVDVGIRLASGGTTFEASSAISQNVTYDDAFRDDPLFIDQAWIAYRPPIVESWGLSLVGGKVASPYLASRISWDGDISPEGGYVKIAPRVLAPHRLMLIGGAYVLEEQDQGVPTPQGAFTPGQDAYLLFSQLRGGIDDVGPFDLDGWVSHLHYVRPTIAVRSANAAAAFGNNTNAGNRFVSEFGIVSGGIKAAFELGHRPAWIMGEYSHNDAARVVPSTGRREDDAWVVEAQWGKAKKKGTWSVSALYASVEADALLAAFIESDWGAGLGSTNFEGWRGNFTVALTDHLRLALNYLSVTEEEKYRADPDQNLFQADVIVEF